ncbi:serine/threonine-protein kinase [Tuwongella immobilis]|uniref:Protein kinase domain-containing protein n=1 Tax=Tuwongella immobilis TaxID=692036 RepID=A0A6C2YU09_9BACT|nr:serine/threonine-protein kinase [Tuwongella immobilis]VIP04613.1 serine threonine protein kinase : Pkn10 OS=Stigmatella aurantiaca (strain DW4/3-1) GN=STIAU_6655 PE=3 SV=1: Pkinase: DZR [Tuwongella immobilis]VTS06587.1 serine threonine protein kinase : Pkn10 OS=Stigmatella aurantiaca (strain DW4/3-1) GN=STIAU_6655 PE=3 SV=1: Pkinase: DZR [Tuwongella immobilis]
MTQPRLTQTCLVCNRSTDDALMTCLEPNCPRLNTTQTHLLQQSTQLPVPSPSPALTGVEVSPLEIPGYTIIREIGRGGMGTVYEGLQQSLKRRVAIKVLEEQMGTRAGFAARFELEAEALARLSHPNIVSIIDRGRVGNVLFFVMEYVEAVPGEGAMDLQKKLIQGRVPIAYTQKTVGLIARALYYAHQQKIVHRDIKPSNILLDPFDLPKVTDFGIAAVQEDDRQLTISGRAMGTVGYMAPEQHRDASAVDHRADIYSLGVVLYEMLTGERPMGAFSPPSLVNRDLPSIWDEISLKALQPKPENRYSDMQKFAEAIESVSLSAPVSEAKPVLRPATIATATFPCPQCRTPATEEDRFCGKCGLDLKQTCPKCQTVSRTGTQFCPNCGCDVPQNLRYQRLVESAKQKLLAAQSLTGMPQAEAAEAAALDAADAIQIFPQESEPQQLFSQSRKLAIPIFLNQAVQVFRSRDEANFELLAIRILELDPSQATIQQRLNQIREARSNSIQAVRRAIAAGNGELARQLLGQLQTKFPDHAEVRTLVTEAEGNVDALTRFFQQELPHLKETKAFSELMQKVEGFLNRGFTADKLTKLRDQLTNIFQRAGADYAKAEAEFQNNRLKECLKICNGLLTNVSDHPEALALRTRVNAILDQQGSVLRNAEQALDDEKWGEAETLLASVPELASQPKFVRLNERLQAHLDKYRNYCRLRNWYWLNAAGWLLIAVLVTLIANRIVIRIFPMAVGSIQIPMSSGMILLSTMLTLFLGIGLADQSTKWLGEVRSSSRWGSLLVFPALLILSGLLLLSVETVGVWDYLPIPKSVLQNGTDQRFSTVTSTLGIAILGGLLGWIIGNAAFRLLKVGPDDVPATVLTSLLFFIVAGFSFLFVHALGSDQGWFLALGIACAGISMALGIVSTLRQLTVYLGGIFLGFGLLSLFSQDLRGWDSQILWVVSGQVMVMIACVVGNRVSLPFSLIVGGISLGLMPVLGMFPTAIFVVIWWFLAGFMFVDFSELMVRKRT